DFSGYTDMAIGIGRIFGFELMENFNYPYISASIREFWRRWHISLSNWLRDYLYIPLGGNRGTFLKTSFNLMIVFLICGIWHGASWTFVIWGLWHGLFLVIERIKISWLRVLSPIKHVYALLVIMIGWVFFRADSIANAFGYLKSMFVFVQANPAYSCSAYLNLIVAIALIAGIIISMPVVPWLARLTGKWRIAPVTSVAWLIGILALSVLEIANGYYQPFLYGNF
ncbi:MAG: MBOAT family protein, partial [Chloroflexi bacterium]|nr:MBOAT family protein [Chloroflexota bacterium]